MAEVDGNSIFHHECVRNFGTVGGVMRRSLRGVRRHPCISAEVIPRVRGSAQRLSPRAAFLAAPVACVTLPYAFVASPDAFRARPFAFLTVTHAFLALPSAFLTVTHAFIALPSAFLTVTHAFLTSTDAFLTPPVAFFAFPDAFLTSPCAFLAAPDAILTVPVVFLTVPDAFPAVPVAFLTVPDAFVTPPDALLSIPVAAGSDPHASVETCSALLNVRNAFLGSRNTAVDIPNPRVAWTAQRVKLPHGALEPPPRLVERGSRRQGPRRGRAANGSPRRVTTFGCAAMRDTKACRQPSTVYRFTLSNGPS